MLGDPQNRKALSWRRQAFAALNKNSEAVADLQQLLQLSAYDLLQQQKLIRKKLATAKRKLAAAAPATASRDTSNNCSRAAGRDEDGVAEDVQKILGPNQQSSSIGLVNGVIIKEGTDDKVGPPPAVTGGCMRKAFPGYWCHFHQHQLQNHYAQVSQRHEKYTRYRFTVWGRAPPLLRSSAPSPRGQAG